MFAQLRDLRPEGGLHGLQLIAPAWGNIDTSLIRQALARTPEERIKSVARWHKQFVRRLTVRPAPLTEQERAENFAYFRTEDYRIGYDAFLAKKRPKFVGC